MDKNTKYGSGDILKREKIKKICRERGYTLEELAKISGIPLSTLSKISSGDTSDPRFDTMEAIAESLRCSLDEFTELDPKVPYDYEEYIYKMKQLESHVKEYIKFIIDLEYDRMIYLRNGEKLRLRCFEITNAVDGLGEYESKIEKMILVDNNSQTRECTFCVQICDDVLEPKFFRGSFLGFRYEDEMIPKQGEIWMFLQEGYLYIGRYYHYKDKQVLKSLNGNIDDMVLTNHLDSKRMGKFVAVIKNEVSIEYLPCPQIMKDRAKKD
jgi:transcriptional regulator with XRE-family HTH domain